MDVKQHIRKQQIRNKIIEEINNIDNIVYLDEVLTVIQKYYS